MAYVLRDGAAMYYEVHGDGPAMLLAHGFTATGRMWAPQIDLLAKTHKVVVWDMRGHGRSDSPADPALYSERATLDDMAAILDAVGAERAVVGGHSLGGYMSLAFHRDRRERVAGLILCGTGPGYRKDESRETWNGTANRIGDLLQQNGLRQLDQFGVESVACDHKSVQGLVHAARGMLTQRDGSVIATLETVAVPTLIAVGADDAGYLTGCRYMASKIPDAELLVFEGSGHAPNLEKTTQFNTGLKAFVDGRLTPLGV
jgi:pimeloyl-ACP methyl ester carboxylesterase